MNEHEPNSESQPRLAQALRKLERDRVFVPQQRDEEIASSLRGAFAKQFEGRVPRVPWRNWLAIAAGLVLLVLGLWYVLQPRTTARADLNGDGAVDIMDAFALARRIEAGQGGPDLNGDGLVDQADVEVIAARAVNLNGGRS